VKEHGLEGSFWPSEQQKLLLRTAFAGGSRSLDAWGRLRPQLDLDELELGSFSLLPFVHRQLERLQVDDPYLPKLAGIRRRTWYVNGLQLETMKPVLQALDEAGVDAVVAGGWQFPARYHGSDFGLRPLSGLELLIRPEAASACVRAIGAVGFGSAAAGATHGSVQLAHPDGRTCTLHTRFAQDFSVPEAGIELDDLRDETTEVSLGGTPAHVLASTDELLRVCLDGARAGLLPDVLWVADALTVLGSDMRPAIDWQRLVENARRLRATLRLRDALLYLHREQDAEVPDEAIEQLNATQPRRREILAYKEAGRKGRVFGPLPRTATRFLQVTADRPLPTAISTLPTFLRDELGLRTRAEVPIELVRRASARFRAGRVNPRRQPTPRAKRHPIEA
jgi:hypothetical protein